MSNKRKKCSNCKYCVETESKTTSGEVYSTCMNTVSDNYKNLFFKDSHSCRFDRRFIQ